MPTKGRDISVKERRGRSPLWPRKVEIGQQTRRLVYPPSSPERKHGLTSMEYRKIPIYDKHTVSSILYALNTIKPPSVDNARFVTQSKVMSFRSKAPNAYMNMNTTGSTRKSDIPKVIVHGKKRRRQPAKLLDHNTVTHYQDDKTVPIVNSDILTLENCDNQRMDREDDDHAILTCEVDERISIEDTDDEINQQDQRDKPPDGSKDVDRHEEPDQREVKEVPKEEDRTPNEAVAHGKKETAAYDYVIEEVLKKQRLNNVKALVGTFEILISCQCDDVSKNNCEHIKN